MDHTLRNKNLGNTTQLQSLAVSLRLMSAWVSHSRLFDLWFFICKEGIIVVPKSEGSKINSGAAKFVYILASLAGVGGWGVEGLLLNSKAQAAFQA